MKSFRLQNIKSFADTGEIELKPITVFVGPNSSGKSSLLRFPMVLSQTYLEDTISPIIFNGKYVDYGNFEDVVHNHSGDRLNFSLKFDIQEFFRETTHLPLLLGGYVVPNGFQQNRELNLDVTIGKIEDKVIVDKWKIGTDGNIIFSLQRKSAKYEANLYYYFPRERGEKLIQLDYPVSFLMDEPLFGKFLPGGFGFTMMNGEDVVRIFEKIAEGKFNYNRRKFSGILEILGNTSLNQFDLEGHYGTRSKLSPDDEEIANYFDLIVATFSTINIIFLEGLGRYIREFAQRLNYVGPFRTGPERVYRQSDSLHDYVGKSGEYSSMLLKQAEKDQHPSFQKVSKWFSEAMGYQIGIEEIAGSNLYRIKVYSEQNPDGDDLIDVGYGISQILPIVTQLYYDKQRGNEYRANAGKYSSEIFVIEQPEIHLHPKAQAELANLFVERISGKRNESQIIIETHSEHLIRRLQSLVADPDNPFSSNDVAIYYVDRKGAGDSSVKKMELNQKGQFKEKWPSGFFDKGYLLSQELIRNASKKAAQ